MNWKGDEVQIRRADFRWPDNQVRSNLILCPRTLVTDLVDVDQELRGVPRGTMKVLHEDYGCSFFYKRLE